MIEVLQELAIGHAEEESEDTYACSAVFGYLRRWCGRYLRWSLVGGET